MASITFLSAKQCIGPSLLPSHRRLLWKMQDQFELETMFTYLQSGSFGNVKDYFHLHSVTALDGWGSIASSNFSNVINGLVSLNCHTHMLFGHMLF